MAAPSIAQIRESIQDILKGANLDEITSRKVRAQLQEKYDVDLSDRKKEIDEMVMAMVTASQNDSTDDSPKKLSSKRSSNGTSDQSGEDSDPDDSKSEESDYEEEVKSKKRSKPGPKTSKAKKAKADDSDDDDEDDDEALARKLQNEEKQSRSRAAKKPGNEKKSKAAKPSSGASKGKGYTRECVLSAELAEVVGAPLMARHLVVKKMWEVIKGRELLDPKNKQFAICDEQLLKVFGVKRFRTFGMMKHLKHHFKNPA